MKIIKFTAVFIIILNLTFFCAFAQEEFDSDSLIREFSDNLFDAFDEETKDMLSQIGLDELSSTSLLDMSFTDILKVIKNEASLKIKDDVNSLSGITAVFIAMTALSAVFNKKSGELTDDIFTLVTVINISVLLSDTVKLLFSVMKITEKLLIALTPLTVVLLSLSGNVTFSAFYSSAMIGFCQVLAFIADDILVPLSSVYFALVIAMNFNEITDSDRICSNINNFFSMFLGAVCTVFTLALSAENVLAKDMDGIIFKSGKYLISSFVPVIGSAVSGILSSVIGSLSIVKSTLGIFAVIAVVCVNLPLFIKIAVFRCYFGVLAFAGDAFKTGRATGMIRSVSKSLRLLSIFAFFVLITVVIAIGLAVGIRGNV